MPSHGNEEGRDFPVGERPDSRHHERTVGSEKSTLGSSAKPKFCTAFQETAALSRHLEFRRFSSDWLTPQCTDLTTPPFRFGPF